MAGKRQATSNLNHENWDQEEEPEERGTFRTAPPEELKARVIKKATRRKPLTGTSEGDDESPSKTVFSGFSGFAKPTTASAPGTPFAFLSNLPAASPAVSTSGTTITADTSPKISGSQAKNDATSTPPAKPLLSGEANLKSDFASTTNSATSTVRSSAGTSIFGNAVTNELLKAPGSMFKSAEKTVAGNAINASKEYRDNVAELNMAVMKFLQEHMDKNPYCILSPVFESYDKYAKELRQNDEAKGNSAKTPSKATEITATTATPTPPTATTITAAETATSAAPTASGFCFGNPTTTTATDLPSSSLQFGKTSSCTVTSGGPTTTITAPFFSFGNVPKPSTTPTKSEATSSTTSPANIFSFGIKPPVANKDDAPKTGFFFGDADSPAVASGTVNSPPKSNGFTFSVKDDKPTTSVFTSFSKPANDTKMPTPSGFFSSSVAPFNFPNVKPNSDDSKDNSNEDEDKPPIVEFNKVVEDDAVYSKRCKVFVKKDSDFVERGVGTLYLKPVKDSEKTQMLVRADTNLGNILVNLLLTNGLPCQRMGKNNIMMVCLPTPEESKPMSMLLRVKTAEEADELLEEIKKRTV